MSQPLPRPEDRRRNPQEAWVPLAPYRSEAFFEDLPELPPPLAPATWETRRAEPALA